MARRRLAQEQLTLLESFLRSRGNLREMERDLGISYPTIRGRLDALVRALGLADGEAAPAQPADEAPPEIDAGSAATDLSAERRQILERLARRELSADEAAAALRSLGTAER